MTDLQVHYLPIVDLLPYARNMNQHSDAHVAELAASIKEFGFRVPLLVDKNNVLVAGHGRVLAARKVGLARLPCIRCDDMTETQVRAYRIADNRLPKNADVDIGMLSLELVDLKGLDFDLGLLGFDSTELDALLNPEVPPDEGLTDPDAVPEVTETRCKPGDLWQLGGHRLLCGDSTNVQHVERLMGGEKADMVFTDPPYNVAVVGGCKNPLNHMYQSGKSIQNDKMDNAEFRQFLLNAYVSAYASTSPGGAIYVCHADSEGINFRSAMVEAGWLLKQCVIWSKSAFVFGRQDYHWQHEPILYGWKDGAGHEFFGERNQSTIWNFNRPGPSDKIHPTMKPVELIEKALTNSSRPRDGVLDLFLGSGSTLIACEKTGRRCFGMEIDPHYCDVILKRWEDFTGLQAELLPASENAVD